MTANFNQRPEVHALDLRAVHPGLSHRPTASKNMTPHDQVFSKVRQNRMFEDVIQHVEDAIVRGNLKPGDRLPAERELQKMLDVSRGTLRESLRVLEQKGLIEIKTGAKGGIFVKDANAEQMSDSLAFFVRSQQVSWATWLSSGKTSKALSRPGRRCRPAPRT
jgi:DNA-binding transcriptional regulator YhcF (GntR family)